MTQSSNKCSAIAEMDNRLATMNIGRKLGAVPFGGDELGRLCPIGGELGPQVTQYGLGRGVPSHQVAS